MRKGSRFERSFGMEFRTWTGIFFRYFRIDVIFVDVVDVRKSLYRHHEVFIPFKVGF